MTAARRSPGERWSSFWFRPESPFALAMCRVLLYGGVLVLYGNSDFRIFSPLAKVEWLPESFFVVVSPHGPPSAGILGGMQVIWKISLALSLVGWGSRVFNWVAFVLGVYLLGLSGNFGKIDHKAAALTLALLVMAVSHAGRIFSVDEWLGRGRNAVRGPSAEYRWPIQLVRVIVSLVFFGAGLNKLWTSGPGWASSGNLVMTLREMGTPLGLWLTQYPGLCLLVGVFTLVVEFLHPLALISARLALFWVPAGLALLIGIELMMDIPFWDLMLLHVFWIPWEAWRQAERAFIARWRRAPLN